MKRTLHLSRRDLLAAFVISGSTLWIRRASGFEPAVCALPTARNIEGPFFRPNSPERADLDRYSDPGVRLDLSGKVTGPDCTPIAGAIVDVWHSNPAGGYDNRTSEMRYRGHVFTDAEGRYAFRTVVPGRYMNGEQYRPAHVHFKVYVDGRTRLTTQLYFEGDPYNDIDPFLSKSLIMPVGRNGDRNAVVFDLVLA